MAKEALKIVDQRTDMEYEVPVHKGTIRARDLRQIKSGPDDFGLMTYDPSFMNTASCRSAITFADGERGILRYRGYPIEQLAEKCTFLEVAYLIVHGELPNEQQLKSWVNEITFHGMLHETTKKFLEGFRYDAHPMGMFISTVAALSTVHPEARDVHDPANRLRQIHRLIGKVPTIAAYTYRHSRGMPYVYPDSDLGYCENFMNMLWRLAEPKYHANPALSRALDILFILHADHEQNCSTNVMRAVGSSQADPYLCVAAAAAALSGPLHGGANEEVVKLLDEIGSKDRVPAYIEQVKAGHGKLMGFGIGSTSIMTPGPASSAGLRNRCLPRPGRTPSWKLRWNSNASRWRTSTLSRGNCTPMWSSTLGSFTRRWASSRTCLPFSLRYRGPSAGWRSGKRCWKIRSRRLPGRGKFTPVTHNATSCRWNNGPERHWRPNDKQVWPAEARHLHELKRGAAGDLADFGIFDDAATEIFDGGLEHGAPEVVAVDVELGEWLE